MQELVGANGQRVVGVVAEVGGDVNSTVLVVAIQVGFVIEASLHEASWGWGLGGLVLHID